MSIYQQVHLFMNYVPTGNSCYLFIIEPKPLYFINIYYYIVESSAERVIMPSR